MTALGPGEIHARKRPFLLLAVALGRLLVGLCLAWPLASLLGESGIAERDNGDRALFEDGAYLLLEVARLHGPAFLATARGLLPLLGAGWLLTGLGNACLLVGLESRDDGGAKSLLARALDVYPRLIVVAIATVLAQGALLLGGAMIVEAVPESMTRPIEATLGQAAVWLVAALAAGAVGGFSDVMKASIVRAATGLTEGLTRARRCLRSRPIFGVFGWAPYAASWCLAVLLAGLLTEALDVSRAGDWRVGAVFLIHQLVVVASVFLRAAWYARALRFVATHG
jgi:hypothetical protein